MSGQTTLGLWRRCLGVIFTAVAVTWPVFPAAAQSNSNVRIVRLSFVEGKVNLRRPGVDEWAKAFLNTPIQQGFELATDAKSFAEVEFENGSTARLGQDTVLDFTELSLRADGSKINRMNLSHGYGTFTVSPQRGDLYAVATPQGTFTADGKSMFRIDLNQNGVRLEVFKGKVGADSPYGSGTIGHNKVLEIRPGDSDAYHITHGITLDAWDQWVKQRNEQTTVAMDSSDYRSARKYGSPYSALYGWNDLYYYGAWNYLPGYGYGWSPFVAAGWMPFTLGSWAYYPGFGYTWISGLPWGWLPFHYGNWIFAAGYGWCWIPGNFGYWSPAVVNWYQGPGWIGWYPYAGRFRVSGYPGCQAGMNCATAVRLNTFQSGGLITPNTIQRVDPAQGHVIASPNVTPTRFARLPGPVVRTPSVLSGSQNVAPTVVEPRGTRAPGMARGMRTFAAGAAPARVHANLPKGFEMRNPPGIVFNPASRRYERSSAASSRGRTSMQNQTRGRGGRFSAPRSQPQPNGGHSASPPPAPAPRMQSPRSQPQMNGGHSASPPPAPAPRMQSSPRPSPGPSFGRSMQMSHPRGGGMGGGMHESHGGSGGSRGPHR